jgi:hypothetical protein
MLDLVHLLIYLSVVSLPSLIVSLVPIFTVTLIYKNYFIKQLPKTFQTFYFIHYPLSHNKAPEVKLLLIFTKAVDYMTNLSVLTHKLRGSKILPQSA